MGLRQRDLPRAANFGQHDVAGETREAVRGKGHVRRLEQQPGWRKSSIEH
jgi:hypothetical protein